MGDWRTFCTGLEPVRTSRGVLRIGPSRNVCRAIGRGYGNGEPRANYGTYIERQGRRKNAYREDGHVLGVGLRCPTTSQATTRTRMSRNLDRSIAKCTFESIPDVYSLEHGWRGERVEDLSFDGIVCDQFWIEAFQCKLVLYSS